MTSFGAVLPAGPPAETRNPPALWTANRKLALRISRDYYLPGADRQDIEQEALIGLWVACQRWDRRRNPNFKPYAAMVVRGHLITVVKRYCRMKHQVLSNAVRDTEIVGDDGDDLCLFDTIPGSECAESLAMFRCELERVPAAQLTELELEALSLAAKGVGCSETRLCNALNRARRKLQEVDAC